MNNIFLIGLPGCGKSSLSRLLSKKMNWEVYDTDEIIEKEAKQNIAEMFQKYGEEYFRSLENKVLKNIVQNNQAIISTGGGIILKKENRDIIKQNGISIFIDRKAEIILENINTDNRPILTNKNKLIELSLQRQKLYEETADIIFKSDTWYETIEEVFDSLYSYLQNNNKFQPIT